MNYNPAAVLGYSYTSISLSCNNRKSQHLSIYAQVAQKASGKLNGSITFANDKQIEQELRALPFSHPLTQYSGSDYLAFHNATYKELLRALDVLRRHGLSIPDALLNRQVDAELTGASLNEQAAVQSFQDQALQFLDTLKIGSVHKGISSCKKPRIVTGPCYGVAMAGTRRLLHVSPDSTDPRYVVISQVGTGWTYPERENIRDVAFDFIMGQGLRPWLRESI